MNPNWALESHVDIAQWSGGCVHQSEGVGFESSGVTDTYHRPRKKPPLCHKRVPNDLLVIWMEDASAIPTTMFSFLTSNCKIRPRYGKIRQDTVQDTGQDTPGYGSKIRRPKIAPRYGRVWSIYHPRYQPGYTPARYRKTPPKLECDIAEDGFPAVAR